MDGSAEYPGRSATHRVVRVDPARVELHVPSCSLLWVFAFSVLGSVLAVALAGALPIRWLAALFAAISVCLLDQTISRRSERRVFDLRQGRCFKGREDAPEEIVALDTIRAVRISDSDESHQLSLLLCDGKCTKLTGYPRHEQAVAAARQISQLLRVPLRIECDQSR